MLTASPSSAPPQPAHIVQRHEAHCTCGCATTRIETILLPIPAGESIPTHQAVPQKVMRATEYKPPQSPPAPESTPSAAAERQTRGFELQSPIINLQSPITGYEFDP